MNNMQKFVYLARDTATGEVSPTDLFEQLQGMLGFSHLNIVDGQIIVWFLDGYTVDMTELLARINNHDGQSNTLAHYKIYELTNKDPDQWFSFPDTLNYRSGLKSSIYPARTFVKGEVTEVIWYADEALTTPLIDIKISYTRNSGGLATSRKTVRRWYLSDGGLDTKEKVTIKNYDVDTRLQIVEVRKRRQNIYYAVEAKTASFMLANLQGSTPSERLNLGRAFLGRHKTDLENFVNAGLPDVLASITADNDAFLSEVSNDPFQGATLRDMILAELDIWS